MLKPFYLFIALLLPVCVSAQPLGIFPAPTTALPEGFASLYHFEEAPSFSHIGLFYTTFDGDFNRPQLPEKGHLGGFSASGIQRQGKLIWHGDFDWQYQRDEGQQWNNTSLHPDVQPYLWADEATGRWDRNHFRAAAQVGSARSGDLQWGAGLFFEGGQGDRFNDPKPLYRFRRLGVVPEVAIKAGAQSWLALQLLFASFSEDNEMGFFSVDDPLLFRLRGYGTFTRTPFVSGERQLGSQQAGGSLRWVTAHHWVMQLRGSYTQGEAVEGVAITTPNGEWQTLQADLLLQKSWQGNLKQNLSVTSSFWQNEGTDPTFQAVNARLQISEAAVQWKLALPDTTAFCWRVQLLVGFQSRLQEDLATFTKANVQQVPIALNLGGHWQKGKLKPFVLAQGHYRTVLSSNLQVGTPTTITESLVAPDFDILSANFYTAGLCAGVDWPHASGHMRLMLLAQHTEAHSTEPSLVQQSFGLTLAFSPRRAFQLPALPQAYGLQANTF